MSVSPLGGVTVRIATTPQGQGHRTVAAQVVADALGVAPEDVDVLTDVDTSTSAWTVASGNYSSRFSGVGAAPCTSPREGRREAAGDRRPAARGCAGGRRAPRRDRRGSATRASRCAGSPAPRTGTPTRCRRGSSPACTRRRSTRRRTSTPPDADDRVASSAAHGFIVDVAVVEVDRETGEVDVLDYVTVHDAGRLLNPLLADGQVRGGFAHGAGAALFERHDYDEDGNLLTGTLHGLPLPAAADLPPLRIGHRGDPVAVHAARRQGARRGQHDEPPAAIANAVADALGRDDVELPLTPARVWELAAVKPPPFEYRRAASVDEALALLEDGGADAKVLAGGQSLVPLLNMRLARPALLVDLNRHRRTSTRIEADERLVRVGALARQARSAPQLVARAPARCWRRRCRTSATS